MQSFNDNDDADETASTIPYAEDDFAQLSSFSSRESLIEERSLPELWTHYYVPDRPPAPYAESIVDVDEIEEEENNTNAEDHHFQIVVIYESSSLAQFTAHHLAQLHYGRK